MSVGATVPARRVALRRSGQAAPRRATENDPATADTMNALLPGEVAVWMANLDAHTGATEGALAALNSPDESERAGRFYFERDRRRFGIGRGILRRLLAHYAGIAPGAVQFRYGENGKPALGSATAAPLFFNLAHSDGLAVFAFGRDGELGVDVESQREIPEWETIAATYFAPEEQARLQACAAAERRPEFFRAWTRQEAILKALGVGLGGSVGRGHAFARVVARRTPEQEPPVPAAAEFSILNFAPAEDFAGALAVGRATRAITLFHWHPTDATEPALLARHGREIPMHETATGPDSL